MPCLIILPLSITIISSYLDNNSLLSLWVTVIIVKSSWFNNAFSISHAVFKSRVEVPSSKINIGVFLIRALAIAILYFCPPDILHPFSPISESIPFGNISINLFIPLNSIVLSTWFLLYFSPNNILSFILLSNI